MATAPAKLMTAEQFYEWANRQENRDKPCELERGEIVEMSRAGKLHGLICANVARILGNFTVQRRRGYVCSNDTGVVVERDPDTVRGPDILLFEDAERFEQVDQEYGEAPPLLAVEVLSPNDTVGKVMRRVREQLHFGTKIVWVVDPEARNVTVHQAGKETLVVEATEELTGGDALSDFRCPAADFFLLPGQLG
ncbi:MAG: Uma2 family endonuclease [Gemmataceae bacterium]|nr:Uma2 family endonuclease [Gemmataceae bacterium]